MYKHILVPTDGSELSLGAARSAVKLAGALSARITALHVLPPSPLTVLDAWAHGDRASTVQLEALFRDNARRYLDDVRDCARAAGVPCRCLQVAATDIYAAIIETALDRRCTLIYMASHGRKGTADVILGSETVKVLAHSPIPVLVHRPRAKAGSRLPQARSNSKRAARRR